ncbi:MAG: 2-dehydropantoate 2-reductase [Acidimicrobiales bacterium]|nr:MAG: 2-dehydropantoate 2-reductase [Acidimicrobiales bacterium]
MKIAIFGAGSIGCYIGGHLLANGQNVTLFGRERLAKTIEQYGLTLSQKSSNTIHIKDVPYETDLTSLTSADVIILTVKSQDTANAAQQITEHISPDAVIMSLQNGVANTDTIKSILPTYKVYGAMVPYNVVGLGEGKFHRGTGGDLVLETGTETEVLVETLTDAGLEARTTTDIIGVQWSKLLVNLNNALNLLSDMPLWAQVGQRAFRQIWADMIDEGLVVLKAEGIAPAPMSGPDPVKLRGLIRLPNFIYQPIANRMTTIDPEARSSMWEDLKFGRSPEVDYLQGEISKLGRKHGIPTPINDRVLQLVKQAFAEKKSPALTGKALRALL